jgi:poly(A) polymerase
MLHLNRLDVPPAVRQVLRTLQTGGHEAWLVGGCVRDFLLGRTPKDYDIATDALPERIESLFAKTLSIGKAFGIITVLPEDGEPVDVATYREDAAYTDGRHPQTVRFTNAREDARRRDFTVNALLWNPDMGEWMDHVGGRADLEARVIRAIGNPLHRFREDKLRMLRAIRFAAVLGFSIAPETFCAIQRLAPDIRQISVERIREELFRMLTEAPLAGNALQLLQTSGLLREILPEVAAMAGVEQPPEFHPEGDVFTHTRMMLDALPPSPSLRLALAVLLHDVGKPPTASRVILPDGRHRWRFENHARVGGTMARSLLERLKTPAALTDEVVGMIDNHMRLADAPRMRPAKLRRLLGAPTFEDELELHRLDCQASHGQLDVHHFLKTVREERREEPILPTPLVRGRDLIRMGYRPGPAFAGVLKEVYDRQLDGQTDPAALLAAVPDLFATPPPSS